VVSLKKKQNGREKGFGTKKEPSNIHLNAIKQPD